ncbi:MAG TPA: OmpA family protein [Saprospiraceae bacterium]|nr:OmpA family protein [Saprospiraceae bacterium]
MQTQKLIIFTGLIVALIFSSCVKKRIYRAELTARTAAEAREKILVQEILERRKETAQLIKNTENLARDLGKQDAEIEDLKDQLANTTQSMGESASKLATEKSNLEKNLANTKQTLEQRNAVIQKVKSVQDKRKTILAELETDLQRTFGGFSISGVTTAIEGDAVTLTLPDAMVFEATGVNVSTKGRDLLQPLAEFLAARPALSVDLVAYTDNVLPPKEKNLKDTWDWSLTRATNIIRILIRDFNVNANQVTPIGKGEFYPITSNETQEGRQKNRRTVIVFKPVLPAIPMSE